MSQDDLVERIAAAASCSYATVEQTLNDYALNLSTGGRHHRSLRLDRLRIRGEKSGEVEPGGFDETFLFELGVTVISADNLRGKTSILEVLTLILRGERRNLQADVLPGLARYHSTRISTASRSDFDSRSKNQKSLRVPSSPELPQS